jgi:hypothetical protein
MADLIRSAKQASEWTQNEIRAFNIEIQTVDVPTFLTLPSFLQQLYQM